MSRAAAPPPAPRTANPARHHGSSGPLIRRPIQQTTPTVRAIHTLLVAALLAAGPAARACPFCIGPSEITLSEQMELNEATILAQVTSVRSEVSDNVLQRRTTFSVQRLLHDRTGQAASLRRLTARTTNERPGEQRIVFASREPGGPWEVFESVLDADQRISEYLQQLPALKKDDAIAQRIGFLARRFEDPQIPIRLDVFKQFSRISATTLLEHRDQLPQEQLRAWLADETGISWEQRQLYAFLLGVAGGPKNAAYLRDQLALYRRRPAPQAAAFFAGYCMADPDAGIELLLKAIDDQDAGELYRTTALLAVPVVHTSLPQAGLAQRITPLLQRMLDRPERQSEAITLIARLDHAPAVELLQRWYLTRHEQISAEARFTLILNAFSPDSAPAIRPLRETLLQHDRRMVQHVLERAGFAASP